MTSPIVTLVLFLSLSILTNGRRQERVCLQLESIEDVYGENRAEVQTIPGKKGPKGDRGFPGLKGSQAEVDYDELEALINRNVERAMEKQRAEMNETMDELLDRIEELEGIFRLLDSLNKILCVMTEEYSYRWHLNKLLKHQRSSNVNSSVNQILRFQNGTVTSHSVFKWYPGSPYNGQGNSGFTNMYIRIHEDSTSQNQYIFNYPDYSRYVLCEV
uniref:uncharacterized protein LOC120329739 n=1 Tax=Styela clava TaxID=7725 RepID=UPI001939AFCD|nr:uncharacterized protein LOC120329739 [Styela clava]